jgi:hypothetical protein
MVVRFWEWYGNSWLPVSVDDYAYIKLYIIFNQNDEVVAWSFYMHYGNSEH